MPLCASCFGETSFEQDPSNGTAYCPLCGAVGLLLYPASLLLPLLIPHISVISQVAEENGIVSEITFGETGAGAAVVSGSFVGADQSELHIVTAMLCYASHPWLHPC